MDYIPIDSMTVAQATTRNAHDGSITLTMTDNYTDAEGELHISVQLFSWLDDNGGGDQNPVWQSVIDGTFPESANSVDYRVKAHVKDHATTSANLHFLPGPKGDRHLIQIEHNVPDVVFALAALFKHKGHPINPNKPNGPKKYLSVFHWDDGQFGLMRQRQLAASLGITVEELVETQMTIRARHIEAAGRKGK